MLKVALIALAMALLCGQAVAQESGQIVHRGGSRQAAQAGPEHFTGKVLAAPGWSQTDPARNYGAYVRFEPGARTDWHIHPLGQTLVVTAGKGMVQEWGKPAVIIRQGDIVVCPPGVKHWHGAAPDSTMTHLAISERAEGMGAKWLEQVPDDQYLDAAEAAK